MLRRICTLVLASTLSLGVVSVVSTPAGAAAKKVPAASLLAKVRVTAEDESWSYDRDEFDHWTMRKGNCNVRSTVLINESRTKVKKTKKCSVEKGRWVNEYTGRATKNPRSLQIDHRVALAEAWRSGAWKWSAAKRRGFANDTTYSHSLLAVSAHSNRAKSDHDPASWLPSQGKCQYVARWIAVKYRWNLTVDRAEKSVLTSYLGQCGKARTMVTKPAKGKAEAKKKAKKKSKKKPGGGGSVPPISSYNCPSSHPIKGNANSMIYHLPSGRYYGVTKPEECFATESAAVAAGYRASKV